MLSFLGAAVYLPLHAAGLRLKPGRNAVTFLVTFCTVGVSFLLCLVCFFDALCFTPLPCEYRTTATVSLALATLFFPWSTTFASHAFAGSWVFIGFYLILRARRTARKQAALFFSGLAFSLAAAADHACILYLWAFAAYIAADRELRRGLFHFAAPLLFTVAPTLLINYHLGGDIRPFQLRTALFKYPGSYWVSGVEELSGSRIKDLRHTAQYAVVCLFGPQGFLVYSPLLFIPIWQVARTIFRRGVLWVEAGLSLGASSAIAGFYFLTSANFGGWSYSTRWFVVAVPLLWFFSFGYFQKMTRMKRVLYAVLLGVSFCIALVGAYNPWPDTSARAPGFLTNARAILRHCGRISESLLPTIREKTAH
jgi:hypothetical protein